MIDDSLAFVHASGMLSKPELLAAVREAAPSLADIARVLSLPPARITEIFKGKRDVSFDEARRLIKHYNISLSEMGANTDSAADIMKEIGISLVPEIDISLSMGGGNVIDVHQQIGVVPFRTDWLSGQYAGKLAQLIVARGDGDSMQPTILDGDIVLIDTAQCAITRQDKIWAVSWGDLGMIKRVRRTPEGNYLLMSDNSSVSSITAVDGEMSVIGRVIWIGRRF